MKTARRGMRARYSLGRRPPEREPRRRFLIVCEGEVTERRYFLALKSATRNLLVTVEPCSGGPRALVQQAVRRKGEAERAARGARDDFLRFDEVWCVFDVDDHPGIEEACAQAGLDGVGAAVSNPCFELWALLHFQDQRAHLERRKVKQHLKSHLPDYSGELPFAKLEPGYGEAVRRAERLDLLRSEADDRGGNPSTGVYRLTERLRVA